MSAVNYLEPNVAADTEVTAGLDPMLASSFEPICVPPHPIIRARLLDSLTDAVQETALTLISAPAGSGKTVLAASWAQAHRVDWPIAWLTVDNASNRRSTFWRCLVEALARTGIELPQVHLVGDGGTLPPSFLVRLAADIGDLPSPVVVVLDGADASLDAETSAALDFLVRHSNRRFRLVLCGRADPQLPLYLYRLADAMAEIRQDELAFTAAEATELFTSLDVRVSNEVARELTRLTQGWAAGLRLAAAAMRQGDDPDVLVDSLLRDGGSIAEYLFAEVLAAQPPQVRELLLRTSVCAQLPEDLAGVLTDGQDARHTLAALVSCNAFVERVVDRPGEFRVHPLFRTMLQAQLSYETPELFAELHRRCVAWFGARGEHLAAVEHAVAVADWKQATALLIESFAVASLLAHDDTPYAATVESMPPDLVDAEAEVLRVALALRRGRTVADGSRVLLADLAAQPDGAVALKVSAAVALAVLAGEGAVTAADTGRALEAAAVADGVVMTLDTGPSPTRDLSAIVAVSRATALNKSRGPAGAEQAWDTALAASIAAGSSRLRRTCLARLALAEAIVGHSRRALELGRAAEDLADDCGVPRSDRSAAAALAIAWVNCEQLRVPEARRWADMAGDSAEFGTDDRAPTATDTLCECVATILQSRLLRRRNELDAAATILAPALMASDRPLWMRRGELIELAALHLAHARPDQAMDVVDRLDDPHTAQAEVIRSTAAEQGVRSRFEVREVADDHEASLAERVDVSIHRAGLDLRRGNVGSATSAIRHAWELAAPEDLRRPFLESSTDVRHHLRDTVDLPTTPLCAPADASQVTPAVRPPTRPSTPSATGVVVDALTERELQVLRLLSELLSTEEIGAAMFVSVNTVRTHIRNILRKLAVSRRNEAVRRARELALV